MTLDLSLRLATQQDAGFLYGLHKAALREYVMQTWGGWDEAWQQAHFRDTCRPESCQIIALDGQDVGVLRLERGADEWSLSVLEILPQWQRKGIGTRVLQSVLEEAAECRKPVALQVLKVNPARRLYERLGFRKVGETPTHIQMRAWPAAFAEDTRAEPVQKVVAYIIRHGQLLVFRHVGLPEAGIQVPAGTLERGENPAEAVLREAEEETGLSDLQIVRFLGTREHHTSALGRRQRRHFFHLATVEATPCAWRYWEACPSDGSGPVEFELFWVSLHDGLPELKGALGDMLPVLLEQLAGTATQDVG